MANSVNVNFEQGIIENAVLYYTKIKTPSLKFGSQTEREYTVDVVVDKATAKAWNKQFPKQKAKELDNDEFMEKFKAEKVPFDGDEQFVIKMRKAAQYKDKTTGQLVPIPEQYIPRVFLLDGEGNLEDITFDRLVGNGSVGTVQFQTNSNDFGTFAKLQAIRVDDLVVVEQSASGGANYNVLGNVKSLAEAPKQAQQEPVVASNEVSDDDDDF